MEFLSLPDDVLHTIYALLPLKIILKLECVCSRLKSSTATYLSTLKTVDFFNYSVGNDLFRLWNEEVRLSPSKLLLCLKRCSRAKCITYIPGPSQKDDNEYCRKICSVVKQHPNITAIHFLDSKELLEEFKVQSVPITFAEVRVVPWKGSVDSLSAWQVDTYSYTRVLYVEDTTLDAKVLEQFSCCYEMSFVRCLLTCDVGGSLTSLALPNIQKFVYVEEPGHPSSSQVFSDLVSQVVKSKNLRTFHIGLNRFSMLDGIIANWLAVSLQDLEISSTGSSYSTALQQLKYAPVVADICHICRESLERMCLPSTILVKQFFDRLVSQGCYFPNMKIFEMTGIADTKMFLVPGNAVDTLYYHTFIKLCPQIYRLSMHSYSGSLSSLALPFTLGSLDLPWDNRLNFEAQKNDIESCIAFLPNLKSLSILGVEEVESMVHLAHNCQVSMVIASESLVDLKIKNTCLKGLDLRNCQNLSRFSMHCSPTSVLLPVEHMEHITVYSSDSEQLESLVSNVLLSKASIQNRNQVACHIHVQLQSILEQEGTLQAVQDGKAQCLFDNLEGTCLSLSKDIDYWILKDCVPHLFEHNSGEAMYPFTEYISHSNIASGRSKVDLLEESSIRYRILEGICRWKKIIGHVKSASTSFLTTASPVRFDTIYCGRRFDCLTNLDILPVLNLNNDFCQPSGDDITSLPTEYHQDMSHGTSESFIKSLNIPHLHPCINIVRFLGEQKLPCTKNPLIFVSIIEYTHNVHTLFYYD